MSFPFPDKISDDSRAILKKQIIAENQAVINDLNKKIAFTIGNKYIGDYQQIGWYGSRLSCWKYRAYDNSEVVLTDGKTWGSSVKPADSLTIAAEAQLQAIKKDWEASKPTWREEVVRRQALIKSVDDIPKYVEEDVKVKGKPIDRPSFIDAFQKQCADRINSVKKWSSQWNNFTDYYNAQVIANQVTPHLSNPADGEFGVMQASHVPTVAELINAKSPNEPNAAKYSSENVASIKNAIYGLKQSVLELSRVKELHIEIYYRNDKGPYLDGTVYHMAITNRISIDDNFLYQFMPVGTEPTEVDIQKLFNNMREELKKLWYENRYIRTEYCHSSCHSSYSARGRR